ncbi:MAG: hypothetical protein ACC657_13565 [Thiohalomonadales bacterium]
MHTLSKYSDKHLWPWSINISEQYFKARKFFMLFAWLLIAIAMSGPRLPALNNTFYGKDKVIKSDISIMIIADINGITGSEFNSYLIKLSDFIDKLNGEKIGFVALSSTSALISPLTNDYAVSYFYLKQIFKVINLNPGIKTNDLYNSLKISYREIQQSKPTSGIIVYWSDYMRNDFKSSQLIKIKILLEEIQGENITVIPVWNESSESEIDSSDIVTIFGESSSDQYSALTIQELYNEHLNDIKSSTLFNSDKNTEYQQLYSYPLIIGLLLLLISFLPFQVFARVENEA